jgi:AAA15 family ATPase/GTPase
MLDSLYIRNYRNLKELKIDSLGRVNLLIGKNNTGKSSILEALAIYATRCDLNLIYEIIGERGENYKSPETSENITENNVITLASLFTNRSFSYNKEGAIIIGSKIDQNSVGIRFVNYFDKAIQPPDKGTMNTLIRTERISVENVPEDQIGEFKLGLQIISGNNSYIVPLNEDRPYRFGFRGLRVHENFQFIRTRNIDRDTNVKLWNSIALTEKEKYVIDALKIIEPATERIAFLEEATKERTAFIKLSTNPDILPLRSMGDGINRILTIILALVNCDDGFLLIDEFENGLHYSVQEKLWEIIFKLSVQLNIQVFVTTHSEDCISSFEKTLNKDGNSLDGKLIRLDNINGVIRQVEYGAKELKIAVEQNIETR